MRLVVHPGEYVIASLPHGVIKPQANEGLFAVIAAPDGTTIVCQRHFEPITATVETGWRWVEIQGPFGFAEVGILRSVLEPISVSIFSISTFENDHLLVRESDLTSAVSAWKDAGFTVSGQASSG
jgi:hypothetical protein